MNSFAPTFRLWLAAAVAGCYSTACPDPRPEHAPPQLPPSDDRPVAAGGAASAPAPGPGGASALPTGVDTPGVQVIPTPGPGRVIVELAGKPMALTIEDGRALQALLLARLRESDVPDKDFLIGFTQNAQPRLDTGELRIGVWLLQVFDQRNRPKLDVQASLAKRPELMGVTRQEVASSDAAAGPRCRAPGAAAREAAHP